ncbi:MAG TPA: EamA family transporter RarD [Sphingorhabdus sp.]|nr:EamA family transporter RarD [Sphingorhabdus sp.]
MTTANQRTPQGGGLPYAFSAYLIWGFLPVYFKLLAGVPALDILAFRIVWSVPVVFIILYFRSQWGEFTAAIANPKARRAMMLSAVLIAINWLVYVWAITTDRVLATSIGYYLNPLVNVLLGRLFLGERLTKLQGWAVAVAGMGVAILLAGSLETVWISLTLAFSFGTYGLVRKTAPTGSVPGLAVEMCLLGPIALAVCIWSVSQAGGFRDIGTEALLAAGGAITVIPLLLFATAARRMSYTALGFVQYLAPTIVFFLGAFAYDEPLDATKLACFALIWTAIALFSVDAFRRMRSGG